LHCNDNRLGLAKNFEKAIRMARGEIIVLADQDDIWKEQKIQRLVSTMLREPAASYAFSDADIINDRGALTGRTLWRSIAFEKSLPAFLRGDQLATLLRNNVVTGAGMAFRSFLKDVVLPVPADWVHDHWIALLGSAISRGLPVSETLFMYRCHPAQTIGVRNLSLLDTLRISSATSANDCLNKVAHFEELLDGLASQFEIRPGVEIASATIRDKIFHLKRRTAIRSQHGLFRVLAVIREASTGRYQRFSRSWRSIASDIAFSPAHERQAGKIR
jgi:hypothetical protein